MSKKLVIGILAHVDAGKTTLSESLLYLSGKIGKLGRVDNKDAYLDTHEMEKDRGITIFSKQAIFEIEDVQITLLDTPGHVDFSAEMERTLQVLDYAILVISGADGVQGHTKTLWRLLELYRIPAFIFINKMDQPVSDREKLMKEIKVQLGDGCLDFEQNHTDEFWDELSMCNESLMETYLETGQIEETQLKQAIQERQVFPCFFGSALKLQGVEQLLQGLAHYTRSPYYPEEFGAKIFKITRDEQGNRLTHIKITGGKMKMKDLLSSGIWSEKVNQIRLYSGQKFEGVNEVTAGTVCAVVGLSQTKPGEGLGIEQASEMPILEPVLFYQIILPEDCDPRVMIPKLRQIEEEEPELHIFWNEQLQEIQAQIMGEVQIEILQRLIKDRFDIDVTFGEGRIVYKETIANLVEGVGHFEPLRHYAEVHLLLEPGELGSGVQFETQCSEDLLARNWQRLVLTHLQEKEHKGVLTGSVITDMKITLVAGKAHNKHTEGGDFREATYRAVRQGLKEAESVLLEPYYSFQLELPEHMVGRAMTDIEKMFGTSEISQTNGETTILIGSAPVATMRNYQKEVTSYTKGHGRLFCSLKGYETCHNTDEIVAQIGYDSERDFENPTASVFCANGTGFLVNWDEVKQYMHVECTLQKDRGIFGGEMQSQNSSSEERTTSLEEIEEIFNKTFYANQGRKSVWKREKNFGSVGIEPTSIYYTAIPKEKKEEYLLVDGYNVIYAWDDLKELTEEHMDGARGKLLDILSNYQGIRQCEIIVVFDAYRVQGQREELTDYHNIHVVYTKEAQTADQYIEKFAHDNQKKYNITVATSDGLQQLIVRGAGSALLSARELRIEIEEASIKLKQKYQEMQHIGRSFVQDSLSEETKKQLEELNKDKE